MKKKLESIRIEYNYKSINYHNLLPNPLDQLKLWMNEAIDSKVKDPNAVILSTYDNAKGIQSRVVLIKDINQSGLVFYTNFDSLKGSQIANNKHVSLCFFWADLERQVRINGSVKKISDSDSDAYWNSRPINSKISAIFSKQSQEIKKDFNFEKAFKSFNKKYENQVISRPNNWGGYIVNPSYFEFWVGRKNRQHDRFVYEKKEEWLIRRLFP